MVSSIPLFKTTHAEIIIIEGIARVLAWTEMIMKE
jgi:hypothetical protein